MGKHHGDFKMRLYEKDCPNIMDRFNMSNFPSCHMMDDHWLVYEQPNYMGRDFYLRPGEYRRYSDWGGSSRMGSIRRIMGL